MLWIIDFFITAFVIIGLSYLLPGVHIKNYRTALWVTFLIALIDATVGAILRFILLPFNWLTFGFIYFAIYVGIIILVDKIVSNFRLSNYLWAVIFAALLSIANSIIDAILHSS